MWWLAGPSQPFSRAKYQTLLPLNPQVMPMHHVRSLSYGLASLSSKKLLFSAASFVGCCKTPQHPSSHLPATITLPPARPHGTTTEPEWPSGWLTQTRGARPILLGGGCVIVRSSSQACMQLARPNAHRFSTFATAIRGPSSAGVAVVRRERSRRYQHAGYRFREYQGWEGGPSPGKASLLLRPVLFTGAVVRSRSLHVPHCVLYWMRWSRCVA